jgi:hypothetical protein
MIFAKEAGPRVSLIPVAVWVNSQKRLMVFLILRDEGLALASAYAPVVLPLFVENVQRHSSCVLITHTPVIPTGTSGQRESIFPLLKSVSRTH